jgi:hypothetical protein
MEEHPVMNLTEDVHRRFSWIELGIGLGWEIEYGDSEHLSSGFDIRAVQCEKRLTEGRLFATCGIDPGRVRRTAVAEDPFVLPASFGNQQVRVGRT